jgi:hypothetical protein
LTIQSNRIEEGRKQGKGMQGKGRSGFWTVDLPMPMPMRMPTLIWIELDRDCDCLVCVSGDA